MNKFLKIIVFTSIVLFSSCVNDSNPEEFTVREYKKIRNEITEYFENDDFTCKNEVDKYEKEAWEDSQGRDNNKYIEPTVCRKITEKKIEGNTYESEITYRLPQYESMIYNKTINVSNELNIMITNTIFPKEKLSNNGTFICFRQETYYKTVYFELEKYDKQKYLSKEDRYIYIGLSNSQSDIEYFKYYQNIFKNGLPYEVKKNTTDEENAYFDLIVEKGYTDNLLNEFKVNKEVADEIAEKFEKSETYDKIYNLKY